MNCPVCRTENLELTDIDRGLIAGVCPKCDGKWISLDSYEEWLSFANEYQTPVDEDFEIPSFPKFEAARICPRCQRILTKYTVDVDLPVKIDRCSNCSGVWLDKMVWETLRRKNLHNSLSKVFTDYWQREVKKSESRKTLDGLNRKRFGEEDYARILEFKRWVFKHPKRDEILTFLRDSNPLQR